jgi:hypothetical protein
MALLRKTSAPAFLASLAVHLVAAGAVGLARRPVSAPALESIAMDVEIEAPPLAPPTPAPPEPVGPAPSEAVAAVTPAVATRSNASRERAQALPGPLPADPTAGVAPEAASSSGTWSLPPAHPLDLGIGTYWKSVATNDPMPTPRAEAQPEPAPRPSPDRILRDGLDAHDRALGLGHGGPLISAAHDAASPSIAPDTGTATFDVESDATGKVVTARVVSASAEPGAWNDVAQELVRLMSAKTLHVLRDARGMRTRLRIVAERTLPSGAPYARSTGAVPEDACAGDPVGPGGLGRKCRGGMPVGLSQSFDVADIGARSSRIVRVQLLGEAAL